MAAVKIELGENFYLFRKSTGPARQAVLEAHGAYSPSAAAPTAPLWTSATRLIWYCPHDKLNSGGYDTGDILNAGGYLKGNQLPRYYELTDQTVYNYRIPKFRSEAAMSYDQLLTVVDSRKFAIDVITTRNRKLLPDPHLKDLLKELAANNLNYTYLLCNICRGSSAVNVITNTNEHDVHENKKNPATLNNWLTTLPNWDNATNL